MDPCAERSSPPDGGWGWFVVFGAFMIHFVVDGLINSFGVFYIEFLHYFDESKEATSWIPSILTGITLCSGPIASMLVNKYGSRAVAIAGSILASLCLLASAWAPSVLVLYFTIGLGTGLGFGLIYFAAIVTVTWYFEKYRSFATGISVCGSGLGTLTLGPFIQYLIDTFGWRNTMIITSGIVLSCIIFGSLFRPLELVKETSITMKSLSKSGKEMKKRRWSMETMDRKGISRESIASNTDRAKEHRPNSHDDATSVLSDRPSQSICTTKGIGNHGSDSTETSFGLIRRDIFARDSVHIVRRRSESFVNSEENIARQSASSLRSLPNGTSYKLNDTMECLPHAEERTGMLHQMSQLSLLKNPLFLLFAFSNFFMHFGMVIPYVYLMAQAEKRGIYKGVSSYLIIIIGAANTVGRIVIGYIAGKPGINRLLVYNFCLTLCGLCTLFSAFCISLTSFAIYGAIFGFTIAGYIGLMSVNLVDFLGLERFTNAFGLLLVFEGCASFLGPPTAGWLYDVFNSYDPSFFVAGGTMIVAGLLSFILRPIQERIKNQTDGEDIPTRIDVMS